MDLTYNRKINICTGESRKSVNWKPQSLMLSDLYDRLSKPVQSTETMEAYLQLTKKEQDVLKDVGGFVGGTLNSPRRKADTVTGRDVLTLDLDHIPAGQTEAVIKKVNSMGAGFCVYSTRKHRPDAPRLRIVIPLNRTATPDEYEACARKVAAEWIGIEMCDPTTFQPHRLMYWGSHCSDGEWVFCVQDGAFLSVDGVLALYQDWHDISSWPTVPGSKEPNKQASHQTDPLTKDNLVGDFCRAYTVVEAMDLIPGVYESAGDGRYTYTGGSTTGGAVTYDDDKFLFSYHATDPCSGQLVNAWDMVRIHKFGHLDDEAKPGTAGASLPSYKAMQDFALKDPAVTAQGDARRAQAAFQPLNDQGPAESQTGAQDDGSWQAKLTHTSKGLENSLQNYRAALETAPKLAGMIRKNQFSGRIDVTGPLPWRRSSESEVWSDEDMAKLRIYLEPFFGKPSKADLQDAVAAAAGDQAYHPVRDYLNGLVWDGRPRLDTLFIDYLGAEDSEYTRAVTRKSFVAAVARIMTPGCKYDTMVVLVGKQGRHKSTILAKMGGSWFSDSLRTFGDKDAMETIQGTWLNEVAEMQALSKADVNAVKMFLSKTEDYYRAAYAHYPEERPRQCVFFGTTNTPQCLTDITGGRRFLIVDIDQQMRTKDVFKDLDAERDQLWAEAVVLFRQHEPLYLPPHLDAIARSLQESHRSQHPWEQLVRNFLDSEIPADWATWEEDRRRLYWHGQAKYDGALVPRSRVCAQEIWCEALEKKKGDMKKSDSVEINGILDNIDGWTKAGLQRAGKPYGHQKCYERRAER